MHTHTHCESLNCKSIIVSAAEHCDRARTNPPALACSPQAIYADFIVIITVVDCQGRPALWHRTNWFAFAFMQLCSLTIVFHHQPPGQSTSRRVSRVAKVRRWSELGHNKLCIITRKFAFIPLACRNHLTIASHCEGLTYLLLCPVRFAWPTIGCTHVESSADLFAFFEAVIQRILPSDTPRALLRFRVCSLWLNVCVHFVWFASKLGGIAHSEYKKSGKKVPRLIYVWT